MELSTFELLVKRIAPLNGQPAVTAVARRVVQGYFLTLSNLESIDLTFQLEFFISRPNPPDPDRTLDGRADAIYDIAGANVPLFLYGNSTSIRFATSFRVPAKQTISVQLLPKPFMFSDLNPDFEVRGYVSLSLPALFDIDSFSFKPQSNQPVQVLLNPEMRGTFLPNNYPAALGGDFDQINYPLAIATGKSLNAITPDSGFLLGIPSVSPAVRETLKMQFNDRLATASSPEARSQAIVEFGDLVRNSSITTAQNFNDVINNQWKVP
ncbi:MAG: hypothetical protein MUF72_05025 [Elainella sp. Prado103]|nr:hypothetical protein [Elainella sp. Prado103]